MEETPWRSEWSVMTPIKCLSLKTGAPDIPSHSDLPASGRNSRGVLVVLSISFPLARPDSSGTEPVMWAVSRTVLRSASRANSMNLGYPIASHSKKPARAFVSTSRATCATGIDEKSPGFRVQSPVKMTKSELGKSDMMEAG